MGRGDHAQPEERVPRRARRDPAHASAQARRGVEHRFRHGHPRPAERLGIFGVESRIIGFTRAVSLELKDTGVRINCFGPGATDTPLWRVGKTEED